MYHWLVGHDRPHATLHAGKQIVIDEVLILDLSGKPTRLKNVEAIIIPGNEMHVVLGTEATTRIYELNDSDPSPLQTKSDARCMEEVEEALLRLCDGLQQMKELKKKRELK